MASDEGSVQHLLFVYGTLKPGFPNSARMPTGIKYIGDVYTAERFPLVIASDTGIPYMVHEPGHQSAKHVKGVLCEVSTAHLQTLDEFELVHESHYERCQIRVRDATGKEHMAGCYFRDRDDAVSKTSKWYPLEQLLALEMLDEYDMDRAALYVPREKRTRHMHRT